MAPRISKWISVLCKSSITCISDFSAVGLRDDGDCTFTEWSEWGECSTSCSTGNRARARSFILNEGVDSVLCIGNLTETEECNSDVPCPGIHYIM